MILTRRDIYKILTSVRTDSGLVEKVSEKLGSALSTDDENKLSLVRRQFDHIVNDKFKSKKKKVDFDYIITNTTNVIFPM